VALAATFLERPILSDRAQLRPDRFVFCLEGE
jgi:hypothetical protein